MHRVALPFTIYHSPFTIPLMNIPINMHTARTALNQDDDLRQWAEAFLKNKERAVVLDMTDEEFEKHWRYVRPERMHEGAVEAVGAYSQRNQEN
jgi:hypothetical protein